MGVCPVDNVERPYKWLRGADLVENLDDCDSKTVE
jgi:hypothetical protein